MYMRAHSSQSNKQTRESMRGRYHIISYHIYDAYTARDKVGIASRNDDCVWIYLFIGRLGMEKKQERSR